MNLKKKNIDEKPMTILITGANGMLGEECTKLLSDTYTVVASDIHASSLMPDSIIYKQLDITNESHVHEIINRFHPEVVVNCAAYTDVDGAEQDKESAWAVNVGGVQNIVEALKKTGGAIIHISTDYVFDGTAGPYGEDVKPNPVNYYGKTKLESEKVLLDSQIPWTIIRTNILFGNTSHQQASFVRWVVEKLSRFENISIVNDQFGNPTWSYGLAMAIYKIIESGKHGLYHYAGKDYINRFEFGLKIAGIYGLDPTLIRKTTTRALNQPANRPFKSGLTCERIEYELAVTIYSVNEALTAMRGNT
ncbi:MAG TPA: dTDP-4-dehydrorhamnose reductase [Candidatus Marinimicrobia bacterium]|nr:dTDP-4-dehydrorhamnose reductase [Candidatus Neomarinimicrobiota bacterium]